MTHTLHRVGSEKALRNEYILMARAAVGYNEKGASEKLREVLRICQRHNPVNMGTMKAGTLLAKGVDLDHILKNVKDQIGVHALFNKKEDFLAALTEIKKADLGLSVVISGNFRRVFEGLYQLGLKPHTVEHSLGIWGRKDRLPEEKVLEVVTMCGHGMIPAGLVKKLAGDIRKGKTTPRKAGVEVCRGCNCGVSSPIRAGKLMARIAKEIEEE